MVTPFFQCCGIEFVYAGNRVEDKNLHHCANPSFHPIVSINAELLVVHNADLGEKTPNSAPTGPRYCFL